MPRGSKPGERRGGRQKGTPNKTVVAKAAHILAAAGKNAKAPSFSAYTRLFELAEDYDRDLAVALAKRPRSRTEIAECREQLARILKDLLPYEKPRLTTTKVQGDKDAPLFDLTTLSDKELAFLRRTVLKAQQVDELQ
jgi:hypothetical protein